jgi:hypothetical protein
MDVTPYVLLGMLAIGLAMWLWAAFGDPPWVPRRWRRKKKK